MLILLTSSVIPNFELINDPEGVSLERVIFNSVNSNLAWHSAGENVGWGTPEYSQVIRISDVNFHAVNRIMMDLKMLL